MYSLRIQQADRDTIADAPSIWSLYDLKTGGPIRMPGGYDEMTESLIPAVSGGTSLQRWSRNFLRDAMEAQGLHGVRGRVVAFRLQGLASLSYWQLDVRAVGGRTGPLGFLAN